MLNNLARLGLALGAFVFFLIACEQIQEKKDQNPIQQSIQEIKPEKEELLDVGYTFWWPHSGPFIGLCGTPYAFVFKGTVIEIADTISVGHLEVKKQNGKIEIQVFMALEQPDKQKYTGQKYFTSDCFYGLDLKVGDKVMGFCYEYEGYFAIPGGKSLLKIDHWNDPLVRAIGQYLENGRNPYSVSDQMELWEKYDLVEDLKRNMECFDMMHEK